MVSTTRSDVLATLRAAPGPLTIARIADELDVHPNTVRFHLERLVDENVVEQAEVPPAGPGRPPQMFRLRAGMNPTGPRHYRLLAELLVSSLAQTPDAAVRAIDAGRVWGRRLRPEPADSADVVRDLVSALDELDFAPAADSSTAPTRIDLHHCPFLEIAEADSSIVCATHLGLMRGILEAHSASITVDRLVPFAEPDTCVAHLTATREQLT